MGLKSTPRDISVTVDSLSFMAEIEILAGNVVQTYDKEKKYMPDRELVPCLLMPSVSVVDPTNMMSGKQTINKCEWYEGAPQKDKGNLIATNSTYQISASGSPKWSLKVKKNIEMNHPLDIHCVFTIIDQRRGTELTFERSVSLYTVFYDADSFNLRLMNQPATWVIDPVQIKEGADGNWNHKITAQLYSGTDKIPDDRAAYWWQILDGGVWRDINQEELDTCIQGKVNGVWGKELTFDARFYRKASFRCLADSFMGERPSAPKSDALQVTTSVKIEMPKTLRIDIRQLAGARVNSSMTTPVRFECLLFDNMGVIPSNKEYLFSIEWKAKSAKPGSKEKTIGGGKIINFVPADLGFDKTYSMAVYAEVKTRAVSAVLVANGKQIVNGNSILTTKKYE